MLKYGLGLGFALLVTGLLVAQTPVELTAQEGDLWQHVKGAREVIHADLSKLDPRERMGRQVELEVIVSPDGQVVRAHATRGPAQFYEQAEAIEMARSFTPFTKDGKPVLAKVEDFVELDPPEVWLPTAVPFPEKVGVRTVVILLSRTRCYGTCPSYTVSLDGTGVVRFVGEDGVLVPGHHTAQVSPEAVRALLDAFRKANFLSAKDSYVASVTDNPTQTIALKMGETTKVVRDYVGTSVGMPDAIRALEQQIDEVAGSERWVKGNDETYAALRAEHWDFSSGGEDNLAIYRSAIQRKDEDLLEVLVRAKAPVDIADEKRRKEAPVCVATSLGDADLVERMLKERPGWSKGVLQPCLRAAARSGNVGLLDFWIDQGAKPEGAGGVLADGIDSGKPQMVRRLLEYPVDLHARVNENPLLSYAVEHAGEGPEGAEIVGMLLKAGASPNEKNWMGQTAIFSVGLQEASVSALISQLVASGAAIDARDNNGDTALMNHAFIPEVVRVILAAGSDPTIVDKRGDTAVTRARQFGCEDCATQIEEAVRKRVGTAAGVVQP